MNKTLPELETDQQAEDFVANADLSTYDLSGGAFVQFEFAAKDQRVNMRLPGTLLAAVKASASRAGMPYQRYIRQILEKAVRA